MRADSSNLHYEVGRTDGFIAAMMKYGHFREVPDTPIPTVASTPPEKVKRTAKLRSEVKKAAMELIRAQVNKAVTALDEGHPDARVLSEAADSFLAGVKLGELFDATETQWLLMPQQSRLDKAVAAYQNKAV